MKGDKELFTLGDGTLFAKIPFLTMAHHCVSYFIFLRFYLFIFRERGKKGEREGEKYQCVVASCVPPTGDMVCNPGMCPDWKSNQRPLGSQAGA